jgi:two-component system, response regulator PdtaR
MAGNLPPLIMVVDDEPLVRMDVCQIVVDAGYAVTEARNADEALGLLEAHTISVVLTDITMPGSIDGLGLARAISNKWPRVALVVMSGERLPRASELPQAARFVSKPFSAAHLVTVLADAERAAEICWRKDAT